MPTRLCKCLVTQRVVSCELKGLENAFGQVSRGKSPSSVQNLHSMIVLPANRNALLGKQNSFLKTLGPISSRTGMEMYSMKSDSHIFDFLHPGMDALWGFNIVPKLF